MEIVNPVDTEELSSWTATLRTTFMAAPDPAENEAGGRRWGARLEPARTWGAREDGRWVATLASDARRLTVPAVAGTTNDVDVDALTAVTVNATHRRRGLLTTMLTQSLRAAKERGDAISYLISAEWPIYGRFGYAPATQLADYSYHPRTHGAGLEPGPGRVRQVDVDELVTLGPDIFERARRSRPGEVNRLPQYWTSTFTGDKPETRHNLIVHEGADGVDGFVAWQPRVDFELVALATVAVTDLVAATPAAYRNLWAYLSGVDVVETITLDRRPVDELVRWLLPDGRTLRLTGGSDFTWLCLLDVPAALTARGYDVEGSLVLEVVDESMHGYAAGRWQLDTGTGGSSCKPSSRSADVTLSAQALASAYLGGYRLAGRALIGDVVEHRPGAAHRLDAMLVNGLAPYCGSGF